MFDRGEAPWGGGGALRRCFNNRWSERTHLNNNTVSCSFSSLKNPALRNAGGKKRDKCTLYAKHLAWIKNVYLYANDNLSTSITVQRGVSKTCYWLHLFDCGLSQSHKKAGENRGFGGGEVGLMFKLRNIWRWWLLPSLLHVNTAPPRQ